jgi:hypothetical protein
MHKNYTEQIIIYQRLEAQMSNKIIHQISTRKTKKENPHGDIDTDGRLILKWVLEKRGKIL